MRAGFIFILIFSLSTVLTAQDNITLRGQVPYAVRSSDVWGYTDPLGNEYAIIGLLNGISIVDISSPDTPEEVAFIEGPESIWRDIKTWDHYAYVTNEEDSGLHIIDLQNLPVSVEAKFFQNEGLKTAHNLWIDENGICYLWGSNLYNGGGVFIDLNIDPWNPEIIGGYDLQYCHDGFVRGDTMYTAELLAGNFVVVDITDKSNPVVLAQQQTPSAFTHNVWPSGDSKYLFTTDEVSGAYIGAYNITDLSDINETNRYRSSPGSGVIPHNTHWHNNFLITSYYRDGVTIVDATKPDNLVQTGDYDTSPFPAENGFNGCWGAYPFFTSGIILASDIEEGLFVLEPNYIRASYLEGTVTNATDGALLNSTQIEILATSNLTYTDFAGSFKTGTSAPGIYDVRVSKPGCITTIYPAIELLSAETYILDAMLTCTASANIETTPELISLSVAPNIVSNQFQLAYSLPDGVFYAEMVILDIHGKQVFQRNLNQNNDILLVQPDITSGMYFIELRINGYRSQPLQIVKF